MAFSKIMKKYDKVEKSMTLTLLYLFSSFGHAIFFNLHSNLIMQITSRGAAKAYMKMVDNSSLGGSDEVRMP